jgi:hypothetical protein
MLGPAQEHSEQVSATISAPLPESCEAGPAVYRLAAAQVQEGWMSSSLHPAAPRHLPWFITSPGEIDVLTVLMAFFLILSTFAVGVLLLRLHHLPEHIAHKAQKVQYNIVAVLGLIAMFTHMNVFWIAALLLALIDIPDFSGQLNRISGALQRMAEQKRSLTP